MKNFIVKTLMVALPINPGDPVAITLPNNFIPVGMEVRPASFPEGLFIHHLIPCDENGNPIEEIIPVKIYEIAWDKLGQVYGERLEQDNLDLMDSVLKGVKLEMESEEEARKEAER